MPHHPSPREVQPHDLEPVYASTRVDRARISATAALTFLASEMAVVLPTTPVAGNPYRTLQGRRAKRGAILEEVYLPQALYELLVRHGAAGRQAARALLDEEP